VTRWLTFECGVSSSGRRGRVEPLRQQHQAVSIGPGPEDSALLERQFNDDTNRRIRPLRGAITLIAFVAYIFQVLYSENVWALLLPVRAIGAATQGACAIALFARPTRGSEVFSLAVLCLSGIRRSLSHARACVCTVTAPRESCFRELGDTLRTV
jgi:hypothetical protein